MRTIAIVVVAVAMAACEIGTNGSRTFIGVSPTSATAVQFSPQTLPLSIAATRCVSGLVFTTGFDLVIVQTRPVHVFMDQVTLHLLDGSNVGGPSITFSRLQLNSMFGSTLVVGTRAFSFRPQFSCGVRRPRSIVADVVLMDEEGGGRSVSVNAAFQ